LILPVVNPAILREMVFARDRSDRDWARIRLVTAFGVLPHAAEGEGVVRKNKLLRAAMFPRFSP